MINMNLSSASRWGLNAAILLSIVLALYLGQTIFIPTSGGGTFALAGRF